MMGFYVDDTSKNIWLNAFQSPLQEETDLTVQDVKSKYAFETV